MFGIVTDIETKGDVAREARGPSDEELAPPSNIRDENKIKERKEENLAKWLERLPLDWRTANIAAAGFLSPMQIGNELRLYIEAPLDIFMKGLGELDLPIAGGAHIIRCGSEKELLIDYWRDLEDVGRGRAIGDPGRFLSGFGVREFDFPMLILRSVLLGVSPGLRLNNLAKYRDYSQTGVLDLQDYLRAWDRFSMTGWGLAEYAELFELEVRPWGEGKEFPNRYAEGDFRWCLKHLAHDILSSAELLGRLESMLA